MTWRQLYFWVAVGLVLSPVACQHLAPPKGVERPDDVGRNIQAVLDWQVEAWNRGDIEGFMEGYWRSPKMTYASGGEFYRGWHTLRDRYVERYANAGQELGRLTFSDLQITPLSDRYALVLGRWSLEHIERSGSGAFSLLFRRTSWGWKIAHDHTSAEASE